MGGLGGGCVRRARMSNINCGPACLRQLNSFGIPHRRPPNIRPHATVVPSRRYKRTSFLGGVVEISTLSPSLPLIPAPR